ncbi:MAG: DUF4097 family beta strand repeat protein [Clostridia bacterium]|nr:DUF4097 family beta strand repeat protein [Clostridia bacterium]
MKSKNIIAIIVALCSVFIGVFIVAVSLVSIDFDLSKLDTRNVTEKTYEIKDDFNSINMNGMELDVNLELSQDGECKVLCRQPERLSIGVEVENGALNISKVDNRKWYDFIGIYTFENLEITLYLPKTQYESIKISGSTCDVTIPEQFTFGQARISLSTGDIFIYGKVNGDLNATTNTGDIALCGLTPKNITLQSDTGDIVLKETVALENIKIDADTGDIELEDCDAESLYLTADTGDISATLLSGKTFKAESNTGDVTAPASAEGGVCEAKTHTGDIYIKVK